MHCKAIIFDYIGTLVECRGYSMTASRKNLHSALKAEGFDVVEEEFMVAYDQAHEKYRQVRYGELREVTNAVWVAEALGNLGFTVTLDDEKMNAALNVFFQDFIGSLKLREGAKKLLSLVKLNLKVGLISNFTYAPVIHKSLRQLRINEFFNVVVVSEDVGWRKPSQKIFQEALDRLQVKSNEALYIGDSPIEDIGGANEIGLQTVFVNSQFSTLRDLEQSKIQPTYITEDLRLVNEKLSQILSNFPK